MVAAYGMLIPVGALFEEPGEVLAEFTVPLLFLGSVLGALAIHARNRAAGARATRPRGHGSPARAALATAALGFAVYLLIWTGAVAVPLDPAAAFSVLVVGGGLCGAAAMWARNRFAKA